MQSIKLQKTTNRIRLGVFWYKPYLIGSLPPSFAFRHNKSDGTFGVDRWFNYKGLTYMQEKKAYYD